ncbi:MAG: beta-propeller domain-containing protein [Alphaproteobacteria bacterium]|nr:beta-propeller domain-containing protein [Alphaproteobacteria bacterium]
MALPGMRRWTGDPKAGFKRINTAHEVYYAPEVADDQIDVVHTVTTCDLAAPTMTCKATSVFGPSGDVFYVSQTAVYVWLSPWWGDNTRKRASSLLYRLPLNGGAPSAIGVRGGPVDQFGFREDADGMLNVLVRANSAGDAMWTSHFSSGDVALLRLPLSAMGNGMSEAPARAYRDLPEPKSGGYDFHNRFAGDYVLYGMGSGWGAPADTNATLYAAPVRGGETASLRLPHAVDRIELMGRDAVVVGSDSRNVYFSTVLLGGGPKLGDRYTETDAAQGETRSHGFFFKPEGPDGDGVLGLPVTMPAAPGYSQLFSTSAAMLYLRRADGRFASLGQLKANDASAVEDKCVASCTDWYGNARPIFLGQRTFALMGYELVEGVTERDRVREVGRVNFAPGGGR